MCAPAAAALLIAALIFLPHHGSDADTTKRLLHETQNINITEYPPTLNKVYQMLHAISINISNKTKVVQHIYHSNLKPKHDLNFTNNLQPSTNTNVNTKDSCLRKVGNKLPNIKLPEGAKLVVNKGITLVKKKVKRKRAVSVVRAESEMSKDSADNATVTYQTSQTMDKRRKPGETGSSSPLLNYIFDTYSNTHQHRNDRAGNGNSIYAAAAPEVKALVGSTAHLDCKVDALHDKLVSWVRRKNDIEPMELLTTGTQLYTADERYSARFIPPDIWRLEVRNVRPSDAANYDCQLSAHPPRTARVSLQVPEVSVRIVDGAGAEVSEQVCELGSTVALRCEVRGLRMEGGPALLWYRREDLLNDDTTRGGISVRTEFGENGANSVLRVARVRADDAGLYTCSVAHTPPVALPPALVLLHIIKGESLAELHQGGSAACVHEHLLIAVLIIALCTY